MVHPFARPTYRELRALRGVSFDVHRGEFFGIVGRNGSGKSTLLKILASIYRADAGSIRMAGRLAPFIELGVGFNPELTARENVDPERRDDGPLQEGGGAAARLRPRLRRARRVRRPEAQELLLRDARAARLLGDDPGRGRHPADRRGARRRRRRLPAEVPRRLRGDEERRSHGRPGHPRHDRRRSATATGPCCSTTGSSPSWAIPRRRAASTCG